MAPDKIMHFLGGTAIAALTALGFTWAGFVPSTSFLFGALAAALAGAIKEGLDALGFGQVELADFTCTLAGAIPVGLLMIMMLALA